jgi:non-specific serine/threonine protein kinase
LTEGRAWLARVLALGDAASPTNARAAALNAAGYLAILQGETRAAWAPLEESLGIHRDLGDIRGMARSLYTLGHAANDIGDWERARALLDESLESGRRVGDTTIQFIALYQRGRTAERVGDVPLAVHLHEHSLALRREQGDVWGVGWSLQSLGRLARLQDDVPRARSLLAEALTVFFRLADPRSCAFTLSELGAVAAAQQQAERAARLIGAADALVERLGMRWTPERTRINAQSLSTVTCLVGDAAVETSLAVGRALPLEDAIAQALADGPVAAAAPVLTDASDGKELTTREREVLALLVRGLTSKEIADVFVVSVRTVEHHRAQISAKVGARGRSALVAYARRRGLAS